MARVLIVEDNEHLLDTLTDQLGQEPEFEISGVASLSEARKAITRQTPDIVLLDSALPDGDGRDLCRWIRGNGYGLPILMMTDRSGEMDSIDGLEAGANDYVPKPVRVRELIEGIRAHLERNGSQADARIPIGPFVFRPGSKTLAHHETGETKTLTEKESDIIRYLASKNGGTVGKEELLQEVWGYDDRVTTHTLETHIYRLRRKMRGLDESRVLLTDSDGYCLQTKSLAS